MITLRKNAISTLTLWGRAAKEETAPRDPAGGAEEKTSGQKLPDPEKRAGTLVCYDCGGKTHYGRDHEGYRGKGFKSQKGGFERALTARVSRGRARARAFKSSLRRTTAPKAQASGP